MKSAPVGVSRAERALASIPGMADATLGKLLADGPTNTTWLVTQAGERHVLRLDKPAAVGLGLDRAGEQAVCAAVAAVGLGPRYTWFDTAAGVCLRPFVDGASLAADDLRDRRTLVGLGAALRRLHALPAVGRPFDPLAAARRYADQLGTPHAAGLARRAEGILTAAPPHPSAVLCHNDLVAENIIRVPGPGLVLIDWEYAGMGDPYFDLAVVIRHHGLADDLAGHFLGSYLARAPLQAERSHLAHQCDFYGVLLDLWNLRIAL